MSLRDLLGSDLEDDDEGDSDYVQDEQESSGEDEDEGGDGVIDSNDDGVPLKDGEPGFVGKSVNIDKEKLNAKAKYDVSKTQDKHAMRADATGSSLTSSAPGRGNIVEAITHSSSSISSSVPAKAPSQKILDSMDQQSENANGKRTVGTAIAHHDNEQHQGPTKKQRVSLAMLVTGELEDDDDDDDDDYVAEIDGEGSEGESDSESEIED